MKLTEIMVRIDKVTREPLIVLLDSKANIGHLPYVAFDGPFDEMSLGYYIKHTKKAPVAIINEAIEHVKKRYGYDEVIVRYKLPVGFRNRLWSEWN